MKYPPAASMKYAADAAYDLSALHADKHQFSAGIWVPRYRSEGSLSLYQLQETNPEIGGGDNDAQKHQRESDVEILHEGNTQVMLAG